MQNKNLDRRSLLAGGIAAFGGLALTSPSARAAARAFGTSVPTPGKAPRTLVLVQLSGGNDGVSTIVPHADDAYHASRITTGIAAKDVLRIDDYRGFHPKLKRVAGMHEKGKLAIIEGCGYEGPIRSHFRSLEVWHTGQRGGRSTGEGWVGRLCDAAWKEIETPELVVHVGRNVPYSVFSTTHPAVSLETPTGYQWYSGDAEADAYGMAGEDNKPAGGKNSGRDAVLGRLRGVLDDAGSSSLRIRRAAAAYRTTVKYPATAIATSLQNISALIHGDLGSRVFSATIKGFDTHALQKGAHDGLMQDVDGALGSFMDDLAQSEAGRNTVVLVFSEFGRRLKENGSKGHDHGKAGPMFVLGHQVKGGLYGKHPSLTELNDGDLNFTTDFRSVYGSLTENWFGVPHEKVLGKRYPLIPFV